MEVPEWTLSLTMPGKTIAHTGILSGGAGWGGDVAESEGWDGNGNSNDNNKSLNRKMLF